jgi:hypothetical protein
MPPVAAPVREEPIEEAEDTVKNGFPPHFPDLAMSAVLGPAGQAAYAVSDVFSDFKVSTIISEFAAGLQQWMLDGATNPDDPRYPGARGKSAAEQSDFLQNYYEAMQLADAHRELWLQGGQEIGGVRISNKELAELADRLATDGDFRQRMKDAIKKWNDPRYDTEEEREKFLTSYQRFIYLDKLGVDARQKLGLQGEWTAAKESPDFPMFKNLNDEAKLDAERHADLGIQSEAATGYSWKAGADELDATYSAVGSFADDKVDGNGTAPASQPAAIKVAASAKPDTRSTPQDKDDTVALNDAKLTPTKALGLG